MGCCTSTDKKIQIIFQKFSIISLSSLSSYHSNNKYNNNNIPQLITGRIIPLNEPLTCPLKEKQCVYYQTKVYRYDDENNFWILEFTETQWRDFYLYDPQNPQIKLFVPASQSRMIVRGIDDGQAMSGNGAVSFFQSEQLPNGIQQLLFRHNYQVEFNVLIGTLKKRMKYEEESYDLLEQIACLGIIQDSVDSLGQPIKILSPVTFDSIPKSYFQEFKWEPDEIKMFKGLTSLPSILSTDDRSLFQGVDIMNPPPVQIPIIPTLQTIVGPQVVQGVLIQQPPPQYELPPPQYQQQNYPPQYQPLPTPQYQY